ncbi:family 43 glycosylhydrolase [Silvibacterium dinghuense]|uniref:Glycosyl hydrolase family 43 n=1 Tax=Silvibacterium dinghuense TaxID=1560006 RepID=A0A4Q1SIQ8_9BACT|nr:family 43 glycosylhydrolase [Silvibacterium dinghuense]RXS97293.1 glycosyl hydrolase family 43 [Silvibacterium dinghuense]
MTRRPIPLRPALLPLALAATLASPLSATALGQQVPAPQPIESRGNPILSDGSYYSADPAPLVAGDTLYILAGRDEAPPNVNDFIMNEWQIFSTKDVASGHWLHYPGILRPHEVFAWAAPDRAYAGQIIEGPDHRFYLYAPVQEANSTNEDTFAIGVAVSDSPLGPWKDAHPSGPIVSQSVPEPDHIQNIDPTIMIDDDGRVWLYWGTFGRLLGMELKPDMITPAGKEFPVHGLTGFFEAPWIMKRNRTYYMIYAGNQAGPDSPCTPAVYHACIEYGTAPAPTGPWTWQGVILDPVSSTTSHPGAIAFKGQWYLIYHTADAKGGGHFRRSVAIDKMQWDDTVTPPRILKVMPTHAPSAPPAPSRNLAPAAHPSASNEPVPLQYWIAAVNDGIVRENPLPPDMWATWTPHNPPQQWLQYTWAAPVTLNGSRIVFWTDHPAGANEGVAPPKAWHLEYWRDGAWHPVPHPSAYTADPGHFAAVGFDPVTTRCLRAIFDASGDDQQHAAVAVEEWEALAPKAIPHSQLPAPPTASESCGSTSNR